MSERQETCWSIVKGASAGDREARVSLTGAYLPVVRAYLGARWRGGVYLQHLEDAVQDVFMDCFRAEGALDRLDPDRPGRFRTFLFGVVRNVALRYEERAVRHREQQVDSVFDPEELSAEDHRLSLVFDRAWAQNLIARAADRNAKRARADGPEAQRRVELLRLRFQEGMPVREIATLWSTDPAIVHRQYARARDEFKEALREEVAFHNPGEPEVVSRECENILRLLRSE